MSEEDIHEVNAPDDAWDRSMEALPGANFFHGSAWATVLRETYGFQPRYLALQGHEPAVLPVMDVSSLWSGRRGVSLPFTDECGIAARSPELCVPLFRRVLVLARRLRWNYCELRGGLTSLPSSVATTRFHSHVMDLRAPDQGGLFARLTSSAKGAVKKAITSGVVVEFSQTLESLQAFYRLLCQTRQRHGTPPQPFGFFRRIHEHVLKPGFGWVALARHQGSLAAGAVFFHLGRSAIYKFAASDFRFRAVSANNLVLWRSIERYAGEGYATMAFGRTSVANEGLRRFKASWGAREEPLSYYRYSPASAGFIASADRSSGWHNRLFRVMPAPLAQLAGRILYKHTA